MAKGKSLVERPPVHQAPHATYQCPDCGAFGCLVPVPHLPESCLAVDDKAGEIRLEFEFASRLQSETP